MRSTTCTIVLRKNSRKTFLKVKNPVNELLKCSWIEFNNPEGKYREILSMLCKQKLLCFYTFADDFLGKTVTKFTLFLFFPDCNFTQILVVFWEKETQKINFSNMLARVHPGGMLVNLFVLDSSLNCFEESQNRGLSWCGVSSGELH